MEIRLTLLLAVVAAAGCARRAPPHHLVVVGTDYALTADEVWPAGPAVVNYQNRGLVPHEMILGLLREGVSAAEFADSLAHDRRTMPLLDGGTGVLFRAPGQHDGPVTLGLTLQSGRRYALWCQFIDAPGQPPHTKLGMFKLLEVR